MAIGYIRFSNSTSAAALNCDYIMRQGKYQKKGEEDLVQCGSVNFPTWAKDAKDFWKTADKFEKGNKAKKAVIALPRELSHEEMVDLSLQTINKLFPNRAVTWAIHENEGSLGGGKNPHLHLLICERVIEQNRPEPNREYYFKKSRTLKNGNISGGFRKDPEMGRKNWSSKKKGEWESLANSYFKNKGLDIKISMKGTAPKSVGHIGPKVISMAAHGKKQIKVQAFLDAKIKAVKEEAIKNADKKTVELTARPSLKAVLKSKMFWKSSKKREQELMEDRLRRTDKWDRKILAGEKRDIYNKAKNEADSIENGLNEALKRISEKRGYQTGGEHYHSQVLDGLGRQLQLDRNHEMFTPYDFSSKRENEESEEQDRFLKEQEEQERIESDKAREEARLREARNAQLLNNRQEKQRQEDKRNKSISTGQDSAEETKAKAIKTRLGMKRPGHYRSVIVTLENAKEVVYGEKDFQKLIDRYPEVARKYGISEATIKEIQQRSKSGRGR